MHILFVTTYFEPDSGAAAVRLSRLARLLHQRGHQITVLTTMPHYPQGKIAEGYRGAWTTVEDRDGLRIVRAWLYATPNARIRAKLLSQLSFMLTSALRGLCLRQPDVCFIEAQPVFTCWSAVVLCILKRVPYVLNVSDLWPDHLLSVGALDERHVIYRAARVWVNGMYGRASAITTLSPAWTKKIIEYVGDDSIQIRTILNGVDLERFVPGLDVTDFRHRHGLGDYQWVTFIGTFATQYDLDTMLAVCSHFSKNTDVRFAFIGAGSQAESLKQRVREAQFNNVEVIDWIRHDEIPAAWCMSAITFFALYPQTLYRGTIPAKLYEALACGIPVVAAVEGVAAQMITESCAGVTVQCQDVSGLVAGIETLLADAERRGQCQHAGRAYAERQFDPEKVVDAYEETLRLAYLSRRSRSGKSSASDSRR